MIGIRYKGQIFKDCFESVEWSGSIKTSTRSLEVVYLKDKALFELGEKIEFIVDDTILFIGVVFTIEQDTNSETYTMKAYDNAIRLNKNNFIENYYKQTPSQITKNILAQLGIEAGILPIDKTECTFPAIDRTGYDIILTAYKLQNAKDGVVYSIISENEKISVVEQGIFLPGVTLTSGINIRRARYSKSIEDMVNKVIIYENNKAVAIKENLEDKLKYGIFQKVQEQDSNNEVYLQINKLLKGVAENSDLEVDGNIYLMSGYSVPVKVRELSALNATFLISSDRHIWTSGDYVTYLGLAFENVMNDIDIAKAEKREEYKKGVLNTWEVGGDGKHN